MADRVLLCVQNLSVPQDPRVWREARDLAAAGYDVTVACPSRPGLARREVREGVEIFRFPEAPVWPGVAGQAIETLATLFWVTVIALRLRWRGPIRVLHAANPPDTFFLVALLLRPWGTRFVFDQHDAVPELLLVKYGEQRLPNLVMRLLERASYRTADLVVAPNESYRRLALSRGRKRPQDVVVVRSGPDKVEPRSTGRRCHPATITFAGAIDVQDGVHLLLEAAAEVVQRRPGSIRVELIGSGDGVEALHALATQLGIADIVTWAGWIERDQLGERLGSATIAVSPDDDTPFTRVSTMTKVTDYLGLGLPCVVADLPENRATCADAVSYYRAGDAADLAKKIEELLDDPDLLAEYSERACERAPELLWEHSRSHLLAAYARLCNEGPDSP